MKSAQIVRLRRPPTEFTDLTEVRLRMAALLASVWICEICGRIFSASVSVRSVKSVGGSHSLIRAIRVRSSQGYVFGLRGYGRDAIPSYISFRLIR